MASTSSKAIPYVVLTIAFFLVLFQAATGIVLNLDAIAPLLTLMGVGGIPLSIAKNAIAGRAAFNVDTLKQALVDAGFVPTPKTE